VRSLTKATLQNGTLETEDAADADLGFNNRQASLSEDAEGIRVGRSHVIMAKAQREKHDHATFVHLFGVPLFKIVAANWARLIT